MNKSNALADEEFAECFFKANTDWRDRLGNESRCIHYDYDSDILQLKFGTPVFIILHKMDADDEEFEWVVEDDSLQIVGVEIFDFRQDYAPRYPSLQAAYEFLCTDQGVGDWHILLPSHKQAKDTSSATVFADTLLECARDPVPVPD